MPLRWVGIIAFIALVMCLLAVFASMPLSTPQPSGPIFIPTTYGYPSATHS